MIVDMFPIKMPDQTTRHKITGSDMLFKAGQQADI